VTATQRPPGRPMDTDLTERYLTAGGELIVERGLYRVNVDVLAARVGAGKAGFYRRWPSMDDFLAAVARRLAAGPISYGPDGTLAEDLAVLVTHQVCGERGLVAAALLARLPFSPELRTAWIDAGPFDQLVTQCQLLVGRHGHPITGRWFHEITDGTHRLVNHLLASRLLAAGQADPFPNDVADEARAVVAYVASRADALTGPRRVIG